MSGALAGERAASERLLRLRAAPLPGARGPRAALQESEESGADQSCLAAVLERLHHALLRRPVALHAAPALFPADGHLLPGSAAGHGRRGDDGAGLSPALERSPGEDVINSLCQRECRALTLSGLCVSRSFWFSSSGYPRHILYFVWCSAEDIKIKH